MNKVVDYFKVLVLVGIKLWYCISTWRSRYWLILLCKAEFLVADIFKSNLDRKEQIEKAEEKERLQKENERLQKEKEEKEKKDLEDKESDDNALDTGNTGGQTMESKDEEHIGLLEDSPPLQVSNVVSIY